MHHQQRNENHYQIQVMIILQYRGTLEKSKYLIEFQISRQNFKLEFQTAKLSN
jgi:hypothetical protein